MTIDDDDLQRRPTTNNNDATTDSNKQPYGVGDHPPSQASCGANEPRPKALSVDRNPSPLSKVRGRVGGALNYTDGTLRQGDRQFLVPSTDGGRASNGPKAVANVAGTGSSDPSQPHGQLLKHFPKTRSSTAQDNKERRQTMEEKPTAGEHFRHPAPKEQCRLPTVGVPCKITVNTKALNSDGALIAECRVPSAEPDGALTAGTTWSAECRVLNQMVH